MKLNKLIPILPIPLILMGAIYFWSKNQKNEPNLNEPIVQSESKTQSEVTSQPESTAQSKSELMSEPTTQVPPTTQAVTASQPVSTAQLGSPAPSVQAQIQPTTETLNLTSISTPTEVVEVAPKCKEISFHHKKINSHSDGEACLRHKNLLTLADPELNPKTVCIRVNGTPVAFEWVKGKKDQVVIGSIAGPSAEITARYCTGKNTCDESCNIPKDEFMSAITGDDSEAEVLDSGTVVQWDSAKKNGAAHQDEAKLTQELTHFKDELSGQNRGPGSLANVFKDWINEGEKEACLNSKGHKPKS